MGAAGEVSRPRSTSPSAASASAVARIGHHHRQRLLLAPLARSQAGHRRSIAGIAREVKAAQPLHGHDLASCQGPARTPQRLVPTGHPCAVRRQQGQLRAADGAGVGLGVKAAVARVLVLASAVRAQREARHGGARAIVRHALGDGEAGAAAGTGGERVAVAAAGRIAHLGQAGGAGGEVGGEGEVGPLPAARWAGLDAEAAPRPGVHVSPSPLEGERAGRGGGELPRPVHRPGLHAHLVEARRGRELGAKPGQEAVEGGRRSGHLDRHPPIVVPDAPGQFLRGGEAVDEGAHSHPLHHAAERRSAGQ